MLRKLRYLSLHLLVFATTRAAYATDASPLQVVLDGREQARTTRLNESGFVILSQSAVNVVLYGAGAIGIFLVGLGLYQKVRIERSMQPVAGNPWVMILFGSLLTIPAIVAAILPNAILGDT